MEEALGGLLRPCIESRHAYQALKSLATHKTDRNDARGFTAALGIPTLDGLGADGKGAHAAYEQIYFSSLMPRTFSARSCWRRWTDGRDPPCARFAFAARAWALEVYGRGSGGPGEIRTHDLCLRRQPSPRLRRGPQCK
jgi:hypothetical protein